MLMKVKAWKTLIFLEGLQVCLENLFMNRNGIYKILQLHITPTCTIVKRNIDVQIHKRNLKFLNSFFYFISGYCDEYFFQNVLYCHL